MLPAIYIYYFFSSPDFLCSFPPLELSTNVVFYPQGQADCGDRPWIFVDSALKYDNLFVAIAMQQTQQK